MASLLKISEATSLGLHIMALLAAKQGRLLSVREAASTRKISENHLAKVMQRLARARLVEGLRGPHGGFSLARPPEKITLLEVYEAIEGPIVIRKCLFSKRFCDGHYCVFGGLLSSVDAQIKEYLERTTLAKITETVRSRNPEDACA